MLVPGVVAPREVEFAEGSTLVIRCSITKTSNFHVDKLAWMQGQHAIRGSVEDSSLPYETVATLTVPNIGSGASGVYHCVANGTYKPLTGPARRVMSLVNSDTAVHIRIPPRTSM